MEDRKRMNRGLVIKIDEDIMSNVTPNVYPFDEEQQWVYFGAVESGGSGFSSCEKNQSTLSKPIEYYCDLVEHVFKAFLASYEKYAKNSDEAAMIRAYSLGNRLKDFLAIVLPYHDQYNLDCWDIQRVQSIDNKLDDYIDALNQASSISCVNCTVHTPILKGGSLAAFGESERMLDLSLGQSEADEEEFFHSDSSFGDFAQSSNDDQSAHNTSSDSYSCDQKLKGLKLLVSSDDTTFCSSDDSEAFLESDLTMGTTFKNKARDNSLRSSSPDVAFLKNTFMYEMADNIQYEMEMSSKPSEVEYVRTSDNVSNSSSVIEESVGGGSEASHGGYDKRRVIKNDIHGEPNQVDVELDVPGSSSTEEVPDEPIAMQANFYYLMDLW
eukprot:CAMPEP_0204624296 /NCGR_PEP_ID=MMETSP0717-20131115/10038_1 /ASSEMBLY_ACC=CAM_ASM_000666 /TAXON_ID=230516 /ORGANISM="Chaetoceros curvisetus" /LENGTH=381 /DNA_ID=CAMNT_0051639637 /DNA_START=197 /DNA_END=1339 /DNA_ORIENTATION=-